MSIVNLINGINPSIARLVYYLNFWGFETYSSHAGFYPGDPEHQEYWIQKDGFEYDIGVEINGPIVLLGVIWSVPYIYGMVRKVDLDYFSKLLPQYWEIQEDKRLKQRTQYRIPLKLTYNHPELLEFQTNFNSIYHENPEIYENREQGKYDKTGLKEINEIIQNKLPLDEENLNSIRDTGIHQFEEVILNDLISSDDTRIKYLVDRLTGSEHYYNTVPRNK